MGVGGGGGGGVDWRGGEAVPEMQLMQPSSGGTRRVLSNCQITHRSGGPWQYPFHHKDCILTPRPRRKMRVQGKILNYLHPYTSNTKVQSASSFQQIYEKIYWNNPQVVYCLTSSLGPSSLSNLPLRQLLFSFFRIYSSSDLNGEFFSARIGTLLFTTKKLGKYFKHHIPESVFYCIFCVRLLPTSRAAKTVKPFSITSLSEAIFNPRGDFCNHRGWKRKLWTSIATETNKIFWHWQPAALQGWRHQRGGKPGMAGCSSIASGRRALPVNMSKRLSLK